MVGITISDLMHSTTCLYLLILLDNLHSVDSSPLTMQMPQPDRYISMLNFFPAPHLTFKDFMKFICPIILLVSA